jgi:hypothetical protein
MASLKCLAWGQRCFQGSGSSPRLHAGHWRGWRVEGPQGPGARRLLACGPEGDPPRVLRPLKASLHRITRLYGCRRDGTRLAAPMPPSNPGDSQ